jgi:acylphosphatase
MAKHLRIYGLVQGVGYRASFEVQARALGLSGWVRNRIDGSVEAMVRGDQQALDKIIAWARLGPRASRVDDVAVSDVDDALVRHGAFTTVKTS